MAISASNSTSNSTTAKTSFDGITTAAKPIYQSDNARPRLVCLVDAEQSIFATFTA
jgi:hypothetical protein